MQRQKEEDKTCQDANNKSNQEKAMRQKANVLNPKECALSKDNKQIKSITKVKDIKEKT